MIFQQFNQFVIGWAGDRKILKNGKPYTQGLKLISEWGETCDALAKGKKNDLKDGIGDSSVVLVILAKMHGFTPSPVIPRYLLLGADERDLVSAITYTIGRIVLGKFEDHSSCGRMIDTCLDSLKMLAEMNDLEYMDCCAHAWDEIKNRKGELNELGVFVKESDLEKNNETV